VEVTSDDDRFQLPVGPPKARYVSYGLSWVPTLALVLLVVVQFKPIFEKLEKKGDLPTLIAFLMSFVRINDSAFFLPVLALMLGSLILDALVVALLRKSQKADSLVDNWVAAVCCLSMVAAVVVVIGMVLPVFKISAAVG